MIWLYPLVIIFGTGALLTVSPKARKKIRIPKLNKFFVGLISFLVLVISLGLLLAPAIFAPTKILLAIIALIFFVYNLRIPGFIFTLLGGVLNLTVRAVNGMKMPVSAQGFELINSNISYTLISEKTFLPLLGDVIKIEDSRATIFMSIGDILVYIGLFINFLYFLYITLKEAQSIEKN